MHLKGGKEMKEMTFLGLYTYSSEVKLFERNDFFWVYIHTQVK